MICPKCNKEFNEEPATSRVDGKSICPMCGHKEALETAVKLGAMSVDTAEDIMKCLMNK